MTQHNFFAMISRMKYINRWSLMRNTQHENISEHSHEVAVITHALAVISNRRFGGNLNVERAALLGLYHDTPEILTGDMPTPVKYHSPELREAYKKVEQTASQKLLDMLPEDMRDDYFPLMFPQTNDEKLWQLVRAADKISALIKCIEEGKAGNLEFSKAQQALQETIRLMNLPEANSFIDEFIGSYSLTLDQLD